MLRVGHCAWKCPEGDVESDTGRDCFGGATSHHHGQKESSVHGEARECYQVPLLEELNSSTPTKQAKGGDTDNIDPSSGEKKKTTRKTDDVRETKEQMDKNGELLPPNDLALLKNGNSLSLEGLSCRRFKSLVEDGWLTREDFDNMANVREVLIPNRGKVIQFLQYEKSRGPVNIKALDINDVRSIHDISMWRKSQMGRLSGLVKQNTSQRGTEYTCHQCEQKLSRTQLIRHLSVSHILWMEQAGYSGKELKLGNCKNRFLFAVMSLCDPELLIEQVILKNENFPAGRLAIPLRRKEAPTGSQKKNPLEKKCHQLKEEMARLDQHLEEQQLKLRMLEEREVELRSGLRSKGSGIRRDGPGYGLGQQNNSLTQEEHYQSQQWVESNLPGIARGR